MENRKNKSSAAMPELPRDAASLLAALATDGAYGWEGEEGGKRRLIVASPRRGVSVRVASFAPGIADALCSADLATWETGAASGRRRLMITPVGRSNLIRRSPPAGAEPFLAQHKPLSRPKPDANDPKPGHLVDDAESPIAWLATRKGPDGKPMLDVAGLEAGERLRRDLTFARMLPQVTDNWSSPMASGAPGSVGMTYSDLSIAARQRVGAALESVGGDFAGLLVDVCGFLKGLETIERERGWPRRSAKLVLVMALRQLARHYGIETQATGPRNSLGLLHWGAEDFRPSISPEQAND
jgi:hypothetical protein